MNRDDLVNQIRQRIKDGMPLDKLKDEQFALHPGLTDLQFVAAFKVVADEVCDLLRHQGTKH